MPDRFLVSVNEDISEPEWFFKVEPFLQKAASILKYDGEEISVLFCNNQFIRELNKQYRGIDSATDVLSFESGDSYVDEDGNEWLNAGDIVISLDMIGENARYFGNDENDELKRLLVHGLLHLNGMDHGEEHIENGKQPVCEMLVLQEKILESLSGEKIIG